jgi:hypothetical protein
MSNIFKTASFHHGGQAGAGANNLAGGESADVGRSIESGHKMKTSITDFVILVLIPVFDFNPVQPFTTPVITFAK